MNKLIEDAVHEFSRLPGIGQRTALRLVLHLLKQPPEKVEQFSNSITRLRNEIRYCKKCCNICDSEFCQICTDNKRDSATVCVVENLRDVIAIENTGQYNGLYHILGGIISPVDGVGPDDLNVEQFLIRINEGNIKEVIMALSSTMEGETTVFYLYRRLKDFSISVSNIARGIAVGDELEFADEITLGRSILNRTPYENSLVK